MPKMFLPATFVIAFGMSSCAPADTAGNLNNTNTVAAASPTVSPIASPMMSPRMDANAFAIEVAQNNMAEIELGRLATQKGQNPQVKQFAQRLIADHTRAGNELKLVATDKNITLPTEVRPEQKENHDRMSRLSGAEFDRAFMEAMVQSHDRSVNTFQDQANNGTDAEIKAFATKTLPTLQEHLRMARELNDAISE